jgi:hypothetical protein
MSVRVGVFGATGYSGQELVRLLSTHPQAEVAFATGSAEGYLAHEMLLVKVGVNSRTRQEVVSLADLFKARIVDISNTTLVLQMSGEPDKLDSLLEVLRPFGIKEQARTGVMAMNRGPKILNQRLGAVTDRKYGEHAEESAQPQPTA